MEKKFKKRMYTLIILLIVMLGALFFVMLDPFDIMTNVLCVSGDCKGGIF